MLNRPLSIFRASVGLIILFMPISALGDGLITPELSVRAGAYYQSIYFDYTSAYLKYTRAHDDSSVGFEEEFIQRKAESDIFLDEASLGLFVKIGEHIAGRASWIYERTYEQNDAITLDRAHISFLLNKFSIAFGRDYLEISDFASQSVFDSWTLRLAETRADALTAKFDGFLMKVWGSVLKGQYPVNPRRDELFIEDYAAGIELKPFAMRKDIGLKLGVTYLGDVCETKYGFGKAISEGETKTALVLADTNGDGIQDSWVEVEVGESESAYERRVDLWTMYEYFQFSLAPDVEFGLDIEYSLAGRSFKKTDLKDSLGHEARPSAYNAEMWIKLYEILILSTRIQGAKDFHPYPTLADEAREIGPILALLVGKNLKISVEYAYGEDSDKNFWHRGSLGIDLKL